MLVNRRQQPPRPEGRRSRLQMLDRILHHLLPHVARVARHHRMVLVGIDHHIVLLAAAVERPRHLHRILEVHIVIGRTVDDEQFRIPIIELPGKIER